MKYIFISIILIFNYFKSFAQFGGSGSCNINVNTPSWSTDYDNEKRAVFKFTFFDTKESKYYNCTGMLVNQQMPSGSKIRQYFITARHCTVNARLSDFIFYFNYQSPDANNTSVPVTQTLNGIYTPGNQGDKDNYRYTFTSPVRRIKEVWGADFSLMEIINDIPPHFNVYYAGWSPRNAYPEVDNSYVGIHHPRGDIKKISRTSDVIAARNPVAISCRTITKVIDAVIKWFGGKSVTEVVCNYVDIPHLVVENWSDGITQKGSSGSPLFTKKNRMIAVASWGERFPPCGSGFNTTDGYGKFVVGYATPSIREALNPANVIDVNLFGIGGGQPHCPPELTLKGKFFPAKDYQSENRIFISASKKVTLENFVLYPGSELIVTAGEEISLGVGFEVLPGASFSSNIGGCSPDGYSLTADPSDWETHYVPTRYPSYFRARESEVFEESVFFFPNPIVGRETTCVYEVYEDGNVQLELYTMHGKKIKDFLSIENHSVGSFQQLIEINDLPSGMYYFILTTPTYTVHKKVLIDRP